MFQKIEDKIKKTVDENVKLAKADKEIGLDELAGDVYAANLEQNIRDVTPFSSLKHKSIGKPLNVK